jgi:DNA-binding MarR family transcriptional regulator
MAAATDSGQTREPGGCAGAADAELLRRWFQIYTGMQRITVDLLAEVERSGGLTAPEFQVLWHLGTAPERRAPMNEISRLLGFSTAGTTKLVDRLCGGGLIERRTSPADRRVILAELTCAGADAATSAAAVLAAGLRERFEGPLGEDRVDAMVDAFTLLAGESDTG